MLIHVAKKWTMILAGVPIVADWADGEVLDATPDGARYTLKRGTNGTYVRSDSGEPAWRLTLNLIQNGPTNAALRAAYTAGAFAQNGADVAPTLIRNQIGTFEFAAAESFIETPAGFKIDREAQNMTWTFLAIDPVIIGA